MIYIIQFHSYRLLTWWFTVHLDTPEGKTILYFTEVAKQQFCHHASKAATLIWSTSQKRWEDFGIFGRNLVSIMILFFLLLTCHPDYYLQKDFRHVADRADLNKQPRSTERSKTKVQLEFKRRPTNQKHVNVKSQGRQVSRDEWTKGGIQGRKMCGR